MAAFGDNIEVAQNGGLAQLDLKYDKGLGDGEEYYKLMPAILEEYYIDKPMGVGESTLDDKVFVTWYQHYIRVRFVQMDEDTIAEIHTSDFELMIYRTGVPVRFSFFDGTTVEITMRFKRSGVGSAGPGDVRGQVWEGFGSSLASVLQGGT